MNIKNDLQKLNNQLDVCKNKLVAAQQRNDQERVIYFQGKLTKPTKKLPVTNNYRHVKIAAKAVALPL
jgi:ribosome-associated protein